MKLWTYEGGRREDSKTEANIAALRDTGIENLWKKKEREKEEIKECEESKKDTILAKENREKESKKERNTVVYSQEDIHNR